MLGANRLQNMIRRAVKTLVKTDDNQYCVHQGNYNGNTLDYHEIYPYGTAGIAPTGSEVLMFNIEGHEENKAGIADKSIKRFKGLVEGEVVHGNPCTGTKLFYDAEGNLNITVVNNEVINITGNSTVNIGGNSTITVTGNVNVTANEATVTTTGDTTIDAPNVLMTGNLFVDGDINDNAQTNTKTMADMRTTYNSHTHPGDSGGTTGTPNQPI